MGTTHGDMVLAKFLARNGPSGMYSHFWISRALQSLRMTIPKSFSLASLIGILVPSLFPWPRNNPISSSKSSSLQGPNVGVSESSALVCPIGRRMGVPSTTMELDLP